MKRDKFFSRLPNSVEDSSLNGNINKFDLYYIGKKKTFLKAIPTGIGFLLKNDKDLYDAYESENEITNEVMLKYLDKMNDRYPDWEPETK